MNRKFLLAEEDGCETSAISTLDPATKNFLEGFSKVFSSLENLSIPEQRAEIKKLFKVPEEFLEPIAKVQNVQVPGRHEFIDVRLFTPKSEGLLPVIVYFHRGGWVYGSIEESEMICRKLANETGAIVAAVEYCLAPENKFPIPLEDCYLAAKWISDNASSFSGNAAKLILCGESAGGNLAAAVALLARQTKHFKSAGQLLIYPVLTSDLNPVHYEKSPDKHLLSYENMQFFWNAYLSRSEEGANPLASPLKTESLADLPPYFIIAAEHDALKHEDAEYDEALQEAGVRGQFKCYPGVIHGFLDLPLADDIKVEAFRDIAEWVKSLK